MRGVPKPLLAAMLAALLVAGFSACGSDDANDSGSSTSQGTSATAKPDARGSSQKGPQGGDDRDGADQGSEETVSPDGSSSESDQGSAAFRTPGGDNSIQNFGEEAEAKEVAAATVALTEFMQARAAGEWSRQCAYLAKAAVDSLEQLASRAQKLEGKGCAAILASFASAAPASTRADTMTDGIASLRTEGDRGFALYHGAAGIDYFVPMVKEGDGWKVGALAPTEFP